jgi:hypothetical protein
MSYLYDKTITVYGRELRVRVEDSVQDHGVPNERYLWVSYKKLMVRWVICRRNGPLSRPANMGTYSTHVLKLLRKGITGNNGKAAKYLFNGDKTATIGRIKSILNDYVDGKRSPK